MRHQALLLGGALTLATACQAPLRGAADTGLDPLGRVQPAVAPSAAAEQALAQARSAFEEEPSEETAIWVGRRLGYLGRYQEAVDWYTQALETWPDSYRLRRHRGHRWITLRRFAAAEADLQEAWELACFHPDQDEPDGAPNAFGVPRSSDHGNILYHWALAVYLQGRFDEASLVWQLAVDHARNPDSEVAARYWLAHAHRAAGRHAEARAALRPVQPDWILLENHTYHRLCLVMSGRADSAELVRGGSDSLVQEATVAYGLAAWRLQQGGDTQRARAALAYVAERGDWASFGTIAASADLARLGYGPQGAGAER
ncbi:MAG: hypothetical protein O2799_00710 [Planctomycetota bacterium]|nr:hypothetical protein [Planctomycetota bacterium]